MKILIFLTHTHMDRIGKKTRSEKIRIFIILTNKKARRSRCKNPFVDIFVSIMVFEGKLHEIPRLKILNTTSVRILIVRDRNR